MKRLVPIFSLALMLFGAIFAIAGSTQSQKTAKTDGEVAYKTHCTRCHTAPPTLSKRNLPIVARHMRVKANLLSTDYEAVLSYLAENTKAKN
jgi:cytochrome c553